MTNGDQGQRWRRLRLPADDPAMFGTRAVARLAIGGWMLGFALSWAWALVKTAQHPAINRGDGSAAGAGRRRARIRSDGSHLGGELLYRILLFVHVFGVILWMGPGFLFQIFTERAAATEDTTALKTVVREGERLGKSLFGPASIAVLVTGLWLVFEGSWGFGHASWSAA